MLSTFYLLLAFTGKNNTPAEGEVAAMIAGIVVFTIILLILLPFAIEEERKKREESQRKAETAHQRALTRQIKEQEKEERRRQREVEAERRRREGKRSRRIPEEVKKVVWERDGGRCVYCGSGSDLQYDHVIPHARGGSNEVPNIQVVCGECNRRKHDKIAFVE